MIITMEVPDDFHILNIGLVDTNDRHAVTRSFTKCELMEMDQYIEKEEFTSFPADAIDDTIDAPDDNKVEGCHRKCVLEEKLHNYSQMVSKNIFKTGVF